MAISAGNLRKLITIEKPQETRNEIGEAVRTWVEHCKVWAKFEALTGRELFLAQQTQSEIVARVRCRYVQGITTAMRVTFRGVSYAIVSADPRENDRELEIMVSAGLRDR